MVFDEVCACYASRADQADHDISEIVLDQHRVGGLDRDVRASPDCHPEVRTSQSRRVVHSVPDHRYLGPGRLQLGYLVRLLGRQDLWSARQRVLG